MEYVFSGQSISVVSSRPLSTQSSADSVRLVSPDTIRLSGKTYAGLCALHFMTNEEAVQVTEICPTQTDTSENYLLIS